MPNLVEELRLHQEGPNPSLLLPPRFPHTVDTDPKPQGYEESLSRYKQAIEDLTLFQSEGVTVFRGGPLDYKGRGIDNAWVTPVISQDEKGFTPVHIISLNGARLGSPGHLHFVPVSDADLMLDNYANPEVKRFQNLLDGEDKAPRTIIRVSTNGNTYYPYITSPNEIPQPEVISDRLSKITRVTGFEIPYSETDVMEIAAQRKEVIGRFDGFDLLEPHIVETPHGRFYLYGMYNHNDAWEYYEMLSPIPLSEIDAKRELFMRIDSGCDTGQCYHDEGCECRNQLHAAMKKAQIDRGFLLLCASHNGRGYGLVTKLATEGAKQGINMGYNAADIGKRLDTITAAKKLLGDYYDIRTYEGIAAIVKELGISRVTLYTDNKPKYEALTKAGIEVVREPTHTKEYVDGDLLDHVRAKHNETELYFPDE